MDRAPAKWSFLFVKLGTLLSIHFHFSADFNNIWPKLRICQIFLLLFFFIHFYYFAFDTMCLCMQLKMHFDHNELDAYNTGWMNRKATFK